MAEADPPDQDRARGVGILRPGAARSRGLDVLEPEIGRDSASLGLAVVVAKEFERQWRSGRVRTRVRGYAAGHARLARVAAKKRRAARAARQRVERQQDARLVAAQVTSDAGDGFSKGDWIVVVSPVNLEDGERLMWHPPQPVAFNLLQARRNRDRGVRQRRAIMGNLARRADGTLEPLNSHAAIDCLADLAGAVLFAFTAIESLANHAIEMLPDDTVVVVRKGRELRKAELITGLGIDDKLKRVVPLLDQGATVAGTSTWERYRSLKFLRDELLHVKARGYDPDPDVRTAYDRLLVGEGDACVDDARAVVEGAFPGFLPDNVLARLG